MDLKEKCESIFGRRLEFRQIYKQGEGICVIDDGSNRLLEQTVSDHGNINRIKEKMWKKLIYQMKLLDQYMFRRRN